MTDKDLETLKMLSDNFEKQDNEPNYLSSDSTTYTETEYDELEKELENKIADTILEFKNKYLVLPFLKIENSENVKVSLKANRGLINISTIYKQMLDTKTRIRRVIFNIYIINTFFINISNKFSYIFF